MAPRASGCLERLGVLLEDSDSVVRQAACSALGILAPWDAGAMAEAAQRLQHEEPEVRCGAANPNPDPDPHLGGRRRA